MALRVVTPQAEIDAAEYAEYIAQDSADALKWLIGLEEIIASLSEMPERCTVIPEQGSFKRVYRHLHYHSHRVIFFVEPAIETVAVARIYHSSRDRFRPDSLSEGIEFSLPPSE